MDLVTVMKCVLIALLIIAGYYVVSRSAVKREGFSLGSVTSSSTSSSSGDIPSVTAEKSVDIINKSTVNMIGTLQVDNGRNSYENLIENMDAWTQAKVLASLNALAAQMISDSSDAASMMSPPSDKTVSMMNSIVTMMKFQAEVVPSTFKILDNA
jgi:hypothetical protein